MNASTSPTPPIRPNALMVPPPEPEFDPGQMVFATSPIHNDGGVPGLPPDAVLASPGGRGVVVAVGHAEEDPSQLLYLVRFEDPELNLGPPIGCLPEELTQDEALAANLRPTLK